TLVELARAVREAGGEILHGIVDSLWVVPPPGKEPGPWARELGERQGLPLNYEGRYRWIVFLPHHGHGLGVPQRYYGVYENGEMKLRGSNCAVGRLCLREGGPAGGARPPRRG
ncbi:DNA polymerase 2 (DNA polymerase II), partial [mine drainage metagenome]